jgi:hypothetical protein
MAVTLLAVGALLNLVPGSLRPYLRPPVTWSVAFDDNVRGHNANVSFGHDRPALISGYEVPGALMLTDLSNLRTASGEPVYPSTVQDCLDLAFKSTSTNAGGRAVDRCMTTKNLHFDVTLQPADRYWSFQWIELAGYLALATSLGGLAYWRIKRMRA